MDDCNEHESTEMNATLHGITQLGNKGETSALTIAVGNFLHKNNNMNQMGPQSPVLDPPLIYKTYNQLPKVLNDVFHKFHVTEITTQKCALSMGNYHSQDHSLAI